MNTETKKTNKLISSKTNESCLTYDLSCETRARITYGN